MKFFKRMADSYRRMRNTVRFLLGNLHGFDPAQHAVAFDDLVAIDQWATAKAFALQNDVVTAYRNYEFHDIYQKIHNFCVVELGGFLPGHHQGPALHHRREQRAAPLGADRHVSRRPGNGALAGAHLELSRRRRFGAFCRASRTESVFLTTWHQFPPGAERVPASIGPR
jgi:isoleucyl-tRNA synthetase